MRTENWAAQYHPLHEVFLTLSLHSPSSGTNALWREGYAVMKNISKIFFVGFWEQKGFYFAVLLHWGCEDTVKHGEAG